MFNPSKKASHSIKVSMSWSGGKDSAFALWVLSKDPAFEVVRIHTVFGEETRRVGLHGICESLIEKQAESLGIPLDKIYFPSSGDNWAYENAINKYLDQLEKDGIQHIGYGDIFLKDLRKYREDQLSKRDFVGLFPIWGRETNILAKDFLANGFSTLICAADESKINKKWLGKDFDDSFLSDLSLEVDPCGENGEFHTFCYDGPVFTKPIKTKTGKTQTNFYNILKDNGEKEEKAFGFIDIT